MLKFSKTDSKWKSTRKKTNNNFSP